MYNIRFCHKKSCLFSIAALAKLDALLIFLFQTIVRGHFKEQFAGGSEQFSEYLILGNRDKKGKFLTFPLVRLGRLVCVVSNSSKVKKNLRGKICF